MSDEDGKTRQIKIGKVDKDLLDDNQKTMIMPEESANEATSILFNLDDVHEEMEMEFIADSCTLWWRVESDDSQPQSLPVLDGRADGDAPGPLPAEQWQKGVGTKASKTFP